MEYIWFIGTFLLGLFVGSLLLSQIPIVLFFGIPFSAKLKSKGILLNNKPFLYYAGTLVIVPCIYYAATLGAQKWLNPYITAWWIGSFLPIVFGMGAFGANPNNISDYVEQNKENLDVYRLDLEVLNPVSKNHGDSK